MIALPQVGATMVLLGLVALALWLIVRTEHRTPSRYQPEALLASGGVSFLLVVVGLVLIWRT